MDMDEEDHLSADEDHAGEEDDDIHLKNSCGRETHHLQVNVYRFDRRRLKPSGAGYFYCSEKGCKASIKATYADSDSEPSDFEVLCAHHNHPPDVTMQYVNYCKKNIKRAIEADPMQPVLKIYEEEFKKILDVIRDTGDITTLEDFPRSMSTGKVKLRYFDVFP